MLFVPFGCLLPIHIHLIHSISIFINTHIFVSFKIYSRSFELYRMFRFFNHDLSSHKLTREEYISKRRIYYTWITVQKLVQTKDLPLETRQNSIKIIYQSRPYLKSTSTTRSKDSCITNAIPDQRSSQPLLA